MPHPNTPVPEAANSTLQHIAASAGKRAVHFDVGACLLLVNPSSMCP
jgi:hypothetical protein